MILSIASRAWTECFHGNTHTRCFSYLHWHFNISWNIINFCCTQVKYFLQEFRALYANIIFTYISRPLSCGKQLRKFLILRHLPRTQPTVDPHCSVVMKSVANQSASAYIIIIYTSSLPNKKEDQSPVSKGDNTASILVFPISVYI